MRAVHTPEMGMFYDHMEIRKDRRVSHIQILPA